MLSGTVTSYRWLSSTGDVASLTEELNFSFHFT